MSQIEGGLLSMYEVELRARLSREYFETLGNQLRELGAEDLGKARLKDIVYGLRGLYSVQQTGFCYRIREHGDKLIFDRKGELPNAWVEETLSFSSREEAHNYFLGKGMLPYLIIDRVRHEYRKGDILLALDDVVHLGQFVEAEKSVNKESLIDGARRDLVAFIGQLGIKEDLFEPTPYGWLLTLQLERNEELAKQIAKELGVSVNQLFNRG